MVRLHHLRNVAHGGDGLAFHHLAAVTVGLTYLTVLLGVATKATGAGLACQANWPLCDGGLLNLFPASFPSFFEWIHRVVAGVTGLGILATAVGAWRAPVGRAVRAAATLGLVLLPVQVLLGRETVFQYTVPVLAAHFWVAFAIFAAFAFAAALSWRDTLVPRRLRNAAFLAVALLPLQVSLNPPVVTSYTPPVQTAQYAVTFLVFALVLAVAVGGWRLLTARRDRAALGVPVVGQPALVLVGRQLAGPSAEFLPLYGALLVVVAAALLLAGSLVGRHPS